MHEKTNQVVKIFQVNRDAIATNRGFLFQYFVTLENWIENFLNDKDTYLAPESEEDIKEVGDDLIFTQIKCYTGKFSFNSPEIRAVIFNFFLLYIKYRDSVDNMTFALLTTAGIKPKEKLLEACANPQKAMDERTRKAYIDRVVSILKSGFKASYDRLIRSSTSPLQKKEIEVSYHEAIRIANHFNVNSFVDRIKWSFLSSDPIAQMVEIEDRVRKMMDNEKFAGHPPYLILNRLLSEIFRKASTKESNDRMLTIQLLDSILNASDIEIEGATDLRFSELINFEQIKIKADLEATKNDLSTLAKKVDSLTEFREIPKELTPLPYVRDSEVISRSEDISFVKQQLEKGAILVLTSEGGLGKTSIAKAYLADVYQELNHIIWLSADTELNEAIILNQYLAPNLKLEFGPDITSPNRLSQIINEIRNLPGVTLIVIDNYITTPTNQRLVETLATLQNAKIRILITTREKIASFPVFPVKHLDLKSLVLVFKINHPGTSESDTDLHKFIEEVGHNTLMVELAAKTIAASLDLTVKDLYTHFINHRLDDESIQYPLETKNGMSTPLLSQLLSTFKLANISDFDRTQLETLSLLPAGEIDIKTYILVHGADFYKVNQPHILKAINELHRRGWLQRDDRVLRLHPLISEVVRYQIHSYAKFTAFIAWLTYRLKEENAELTSHEKFLSFGRSIINKINEKNREQIEQPLISLENNVLHGYLRLGLLDDFIQPMINLMGRAERLVAKDAIEAKYLNMPVMHHNLAIALEAQNDQEGARNNINLAVAKAGVDESTNYIQLINSLDNKAILEIYAGNISEASASIRRSIELRTKYIEKDDPLFDMQFCVAGILFKAIGQLQKAIILFSTIIRNQEAQPTEKRNNLFLSMYLHHLALAYLLIKDYDNAIKTQTRSIRLYEEAGLERSVNLLNGYKVLSDMYARSGRTDLAEIFMKKANPNVSNK